MKRKVCHISTVHSANDDRIFYKECVSLAAAGYDVSLVIRNEGDIDIDGIKIIGLKEYKSRFARMVKGSTNAYRKARRTGSELFHFHDPELIFVGLILKLSGKKIIYDAHEDVPMQIFSKNWIPSAIIKKIVSSVFSLFEKFSCLFFDAVISVTPEIVAKFPKKKSYLIRNFPILNFIKNVSKDKTESKKKILIYAGGLSRIRGISEIISAMNLLKEDAELHLLGEWESANYENECMTQKGCEKVKYFGFKKLNEVYQYLSKADIGLALLYPQSNYLKSLPVKAFEYMASGIPIIMSDFPYWKENFLTCALFVDPMKPAEIADTISFLLTNPRLAEELGRRGKDLVMENYSWENEQQNLISIYKNLFGEN